MTAHESAGEDLNALVLECVQRLESEGEAAIDDVCRAHPAHAAKLRTRLRGLRDMGLLAGPADSRPDPAAPEQLGEFRLLERLGSGGMGVVYLAEQTTLGRRVALKLIRPEQLFFPGARERFRREVEAVAQLAHPGIVPIHTVGEERGIPYFAMEHVRGASLDEVLGRLRGRRAEDLTGRDLVRAVGPVGPATRVAPVALGAPTTATSDDVAPPARFAGSWIDACLGVATAVARALEHAHERGVLHRDVKPSNVMLTAEGRVVLLDFGLARREGASALTRAGAQQGSLPYMAPEQVDGHGAAIGTRTDVYALGVTLYEMLALRAPFDAQTTEQLMRNISAGRPPALRKLNAAVSADVASVCAMAMDPDPARRYASAERFAADLESLLARGPIAARPAGLALRTRRFARRHPAGALAIVLGATILVGGPLVFGLQQRDAARRVERERDVADAERARAERNFAQALGAVDALLTRVGEERLDDVPQMEIVRRDLLEDALRFYTELAAQKPGDAQLRIEGARLEAALAKTLQQLGLPADASRRFDSAVAALRIVAVDVALEDARKQRLAEALIDSSSALTSQSRFQDADRDLREAVALLKELADDGRDTATSRRQRIVALNNLALLLRNEGKLEESATIEDEAIARSDEALGRAPDDIELRVQHANAVAGAGVVARMRGDAARAVELLQRALPILDELARAAPDDRRRQSALVDACGNLGLALANRARHADAEIALRQGLAAAEHLAAAYPNSPRYLKSLGDIGINLGMVLLDQHRLEDARAVLEPSARHLERLADANPREAEYGANLGVALSNLGSLHKDLQRLDSAAEHLEHAARREIAALELRPGNPVYRRHLAIVRMNLGDVRMEQRAHAAAARQLTDVLSLCDSDRAISRYLTGLWIRCAAIAREDSSLDAVERDRLAEEHLDHALEALRSAVRAGYAELADLRTSAELEPLRARAGFGELVATVESALAR